jgi:hypothetical protein
MSVEQPPAVAPFPPPEPPQEQTFDTLLDRADTVKQELDSPDTLPLKGAHEQGLITPDGAQPLSPLTPTSALQTPALYLMYQTLLR